MPPSEIASRVGLNPDRAWVKGDPRRASDHKQPYSGISFMSGLDEEADPRCRHFVALIARLRPFAENIRALSELPSTRRVRIWVVEHTPGDNHGVDFEPEDLALVAAMGTNLSIDYYFYDEDEGDPPPE